MTKDEEWLLKEKYHGKETTDAFITDCGRLASGEPLAYVIGFSPFLDVTIYLDSHPLIPRPETEFWVERALYEMPRNKDLRVLDLCAGSGCIGIATLAKIPRAQVDFVEINQGHHATIIRNLQENNISSKRSRIFGGSLFDEINGTYDFILTNPPYIDPLHDRTEASVRDHEPHEALYGGANGIELIQQIVLDAPKYLTDTGILYLEHEPEQVPQILSCAEKAGLIASPKEDQYGALRYTRFHLQSSHSGVQ